MNAKKKALLISALAAASLTAACTSTGYNQRGYGQNAGEWGYYDNRYYEQNGRYDYDRPDPRYGNRYEADRYYRNNGRYRERQLSNNDRVYRGRDNRYYCRRSDGSTGLIVGGLGGAALGALIAPGDSRPLGAIIGAIGGAAAGAAIDNGNRNNRNNRNSNIRCR
ncbi:glycine zipper 2TM domain-containing protein [Novosphingobium sp.]|uniref:glycine zipper 2TM domain-containing protein n=1 Tax=Novosphingobium sp. TaxID=1874826 RepID=UPI0026110955|nr:glycine zipper 2TM domain-containing protein [Novosphingobium sp.]